MKFSFCLRAITAVLVSTAGCVASIAFAQTPRYSIVDFRDAIGQPITQGMDINMQGQLAASIFTGSSTGAFRTSASNAPYGATQIPGFGGGAQEGFGINDLGQVVGYAYTSNNDQQLAYRSSGNTGPLTVQSLGTLGGARSVARGINNSGEVTGMALNSANGWRAYRSTPNGVNVSLTSLGTLDGGNYSEGRAINESGQVAGIALNASGQYQAFRSTPTGSTIALTNLGTLGGIQSLALDINSQGNVSGYSQQADGTYRGFLSAANGQPVSLTNLGVLPGFASSIATGLNNNGLVVGYNNTTNVNTPSGTSHGFVYSPTTGMLDLNALLAPGFGSYTVLSAYAINDAGEIAAVGFAGGTSRAIRLVPTGSFSSSAPEPGSLHLLGVVLVTGMGLVGKRYSVQKRRAN